MIHIVGPRDCRMPSGKERDFINTCSHSSDWSRGLSPFILGPCVVYCGIRTSRNMENAWQFSKVYKEHVDAQGLPTTQWLDWAKKGWNDPKAHRYPMGKGAIPLYSWWNGRPMSYIEARKRIYAPLYCSAVTGTDAYIRLHRLYRELGDLWLWDFDGYDHRKLGMSYLEVLMSPQRKMGHAFVLAMMLENQRVWER